MREAYGTEDGDRKIQEEKETRKVEKKLDTITVVYFRLGWVKQSPVRQTIEDAC